MKNILDNNFVEQAKWILTPNNVIYSLDCPLVSNCHHCVVHNYTKNKNGCPVNEKLKFAKQYLRSEKLKRINK